VLVSVSGSVLGLVSVGVFVSVLVVAGARVVRKQLHR
jgi:hypothetical protein